MNVFKAKGHGLKPKRLSSQEAQKASDKGKAPQSAGAKAGWRVMSIPSGR